MISRESLNSTEACRHFFSKLLRDWCLGRGGNYALSPIQGMNQ
jgi:hypothetical protein